MAVIPTAFAGPSRIAIPNLADVFDHRLGYRSTPKNKWFSQLTAERFG